jgi:hypothetical protein
MESSENKGTFCSSVGKFVNALFYRKDGVIYDFDNGYLSTVKEKYFIPKLIEITEEQAKGYEQYSGLLNKLKQYKVVE